MGVDYSYSAGYGIVLTEQDITNEIVAKLGYRPSYYDEADWATVVDMYASPLDAVKSEVGVEEVINAIAGKYGLSYSTAGSEYSGKVCWLIGEITSGGHNNFWFTEVMPEKRRHTIGETTKKIKKLQAELGLNLKLGYYAGMRVY